KYTEAFEDSLTAVEKGFNDTGDAIIDAVFKNKPDLLWSADCKRLNAAPHYFLRLIASCIKQRRTTEKYQELQFALYDTNSGANRKIPVISFNTRRCGCWRTSGLTGVSG
uniref:hypothetical protein n=1 Tax=Treponema endosymbiont of Eucomonympha sp. TaxID=1580831 RepID=UPI001E3995FB